MDKERPWHRAARWPFGGAVVAWVLAFPCTSPATIPLNPLASPLYSFDLASPTVIDNQVQADDVLALNLLFPITLIPGATLELGAAGDELDGLSSANASVGVNATFTLLFSVSRDTPGAAAPDPALVVMGYLYNVADQAARGHQAGDEYMSTQLYSRGGGAHAASGPNNNTLVRNNYDEGGTDFGGRPPTSAHATAVGQPQDNVDALAGIAAALGPYFSVSAASPSLPALPDSGPASGADLYRSDLLTTSRYASFSQLGLQQTDDVDAIVVFDTNTNATFDGTDQVLFSLTPGSPSLLTLAGASLVGAAADVFTVSPGQAPSVFASAASLGLGAESDDIDALDIALCADALQCVIDHAIRLVHGDFDGNGTLDDADYPAFVSCYGGDGVPLAAGCEPADFDADSDADCADYGAFVSDWTAGPPVPPFAECAHVIPTLSETGLILCAVLLVMAGVLVIARTGTAECGARNSETKD